MTDRENIARKIRALRERTEANGCTEAEALAASRMALELAEKYSLTFTDIEIGEEICQTEHMDTGRRAMHEVQYCAVAIGRFCDCKGWVDRRGDGRTKRFVFFGLPNDVELAVFLMNTIKAAMDSELSGYLARCRRLGQPAGRRGGHAFLMGMGARLNERLRDMKSDQRAETQASTGRDLVIVKTRVVAQQFAKLGMHLSSSSSRATIRDGGAYGAGAAAGARVGLSRPIGGRSGGHMIGHG